MMRNSESINEELKRVTESRIELQKQINQITNQIEKLEEIEEELEDKINDHKLNSLSDKDLYFLFMFCRYYANSENMHDEICDLCRRRQSPGQNTFEVIKRIKKEILSSVGL